MKKGVLLIFGLLLLMANIAFATVSINNLASTTYNLGRTISVNGFVVENQNIEGLLKMGIDCNNGSTYSNVFSKYTTLKADEKEFFSEKLNIPSDAEGRCIIKASFSWDSEIDEAESSYFTVSNALTIKTILSDYTPTPGSEIIVSGDVKLASGENLENGVAYIIIDSKIDKAEVVRGFFEKKIELNTNIESGAHIIKVEASDVLGNIGNDETTFTVDAIPTALKIVVDKMSYGPGETVVVNAELKDQTGELLADQASVVLRDPNGVVKLKKVINTDEDFNIVLEGLAIPGTWIIAGESKDYLSEAKFIVEKSEKVDVAVSGTIVTIQNIGNVEYKKPVEINLRSDAKNYRIIKNVNLKVNESILYDLKEESVKYGAYDIKMPSYPEITGQVVYEKVPLSKSPWTYVILALALVTIGVLVFKTSNDSRRKEITWHRDRMEGQNILRKIKDRGYVPAQNKAKSDSMTPTKEDYQFLVNQANKTDSNSGGNVFDVFK